MIESQLSVEVLAWHDAEYRKLLPCAHLSFDRKRSAFIFHELSSGEWIVLCTRCQKPYAGEQARQIIKLYRTDLLFCDVCGKPKNECGSFWGSQRTQSAW